VRRKQRSNSKELESKEKKNEGGRETALQFLGRENHKKRSWGKEKKDLEKGRRKECPKERDKT